MVGMIIDSSIYIALDAGFHNYHQLTGMIS